jgi:hypothetical protein
MLLPFPRVIFSLEATFLALTPYRPSTLMQSLLKLSKMVSALMAARLLSLPAWSRFVYSKYAFIILIN